MDDTYSPGGETCNDGLEQDREIKKALALFEHDLHLKNIAIIIKKRTSYSLRHYPVYLGNPLK